MPFEHLALSGGRGEIEGQQNIATLNGPPLLVFGQKRRRRRRERGRSISAAICTFSARKELALARDGKSLQKGFEGGGASSFVSCSVIEHDDIRMLFRLEHPSLVGQPQSKVQLPGYCFLPCLLAYRLTNQMPALNMILHSVVRAGF